MSEKAKRPKSGRRSRWKLKCIWMCAIAKQNNEHMIQEVMTLACFLKCRFCHHIHIRGVTEYEYTVRIEIITCSKHIQIHIWISVSGLGSYVSFRLVTMNMSFIWTFGRKKAIFQILKKNKCMFLYHVTNI